MRMWLIAKREVWEKLQRDKDLLYDPDYLPAHLQPFYEWMCQQMVKRLPDSQGHYPWWAWVRWTTEKSMPDLRSRDNDLNYFPPEEPVVRLELFVPDQQVLRSDFGSWCSVLFNEYVAKTEAEAEQWEHLAPLHRTKERLEQSWEAIFDLDETHWNLARRNFNPVRIQGVFEHLRLEYVRGITHFRCRYPKKRESSFSSSALERTDRSRK
jgi:Domain of unknown function (DUF3841)